MRCIAQISDLHFGTEDPAIANGLVDDLRAQNPSLIAVSGDLTQRARGKQFRDASEFLEKLPQPQIVVPGNHDVPLFDLFRRFLSPLFQVNDRAVFNPRTTISESSYQGSTTSEIIFR